MHQSFLMGFFPVLCVAGTSPRNGATKKRICGTHAFLPAEAAFAKCPLRQASRISEVAMSRIRPAEPSDILELAALCTLLWPDGSFDDHKCEMDRKVRDGKSGSQAAIFVWEDSGSRRGFIEVGVRSHADGCDPIRPVGFIEGWYVRESNRGQGHGRHLMQAAETWARDQGCIELASDAPIDNLASQRAHAALGFQVVDRCVHFRKDIKRLIPDKNMTQAIFVGLSTIDVVYGVDKFPAANKKVAANSQDVFVGGPATNASIAFAHLGGECALVTAVGRHPLARMVREELQKHSIQLIDLNPDFDEVPVISSVAVDPSGNRSVVSANAIRVTTPAARPDNSLCKQARVVMVDGHYMSVCVAWSKAAGANRVPIVFDGGSWKDGTDELLKGVHTAICSADFRPPGCKSKSEVIEFLRSAGVASIAVTDGASPIQFSSGSVTGTLSVPKVDVVDTMGAGDIFHGAYCYFLSMGRGFVESLAEAANVAADSCRYQGTRAWTYGKSVTAAAQK
jgi:sugar/nucleoside kinase (ribokinase family)/GNAT superfamily N-acetyltransferase